MINLGRKLLLGGFFCLCTSICVALGSTFWATALAQDPTGGEIGLDEIFAPKKGTSEGPVLKPSASVGTDSHSSGISLQDLNALTSSLTGSGTPSADTPSTLGLLDLQMHFVEEQWRMTPTLTARSNVVHVYEQIAIGLCFPALPQMIAGAPPAKGPGCDGYLKKIKDLHQNNPVVICADEGYDSVACSQAFQEQKISRYSGKELEQYRSSPSSKTPLEDPILRGRFTTAQSLMQQNIDRFKGDPSIANLKTFDSSLFQVLGIICSDTATRLSLDKPTGLLPTAPPMPQEVESLVHAVESLAAKKPTPTAVPTARPVDKSTLLYRERLLSPACFDTIVDALAIDERLPSAVCFRESFIAPLCLSTLKHFQYLHDQPTPLPQVEPGVATTRPKDGLTRF